MSKFRFVILISLSLLSSDFCFSQVQSQDKYTGYLYEFFFFRQPSPRAEAMGRGIFANNENEFSSFYNPAQTSIGSGLDVNFSYSKKFFTDNDVTYNYIGASYNYKKVGAFGIDRYHFKFIPVTDETGRETGDNLTYTLYTLNYSREIIPDFFSGINLNILQSHYPTDPGFTIQANDIFIADIGLYKKFRIKTPASPYVTHSVQLAGSLYNIGSSKATFTGGILPAVLPVTLRLGASYNMELRAASDSKLLNIFAHISYENVLNGDTSNTSYFNSIKFGGEVTIRDILSLRAGYNSIFTESQYSDFKHQFTYGAGVKIPLEKIFKGKTPLSLSIDYVNLKQPFPEAAFGELDNFYSFALRLNYIPGL